MDTNFDALYEKIIFNAKDELEGLRQKSARKTLRICIIGVIIVVLFILTAVILINTTNKNLENATFLGHNVNTTISFGHVMIALSLFGILLIMPVIKFVNNGKQGEFSEVFQNNVIAPLIKSVVEDAEYFPKESITQTEYNADDKSLYKDWYNRYLGEDKVVTHNNNSLIFSEAVLKHVRSYGNNTDSVCFSGIAGNFVSPVYVEEPINYT